MSNNSEVVKIIATALIVMLVTFIVWIGWVFPCLYTVLAHVSWIKSTPEFDNALFWLGVGLLIIQSFRIGLHTKNN